MSRGWQRSLFTDHPGLANGDPDAVFGTGDKARVWCTECYHRRVEGLADSEILRLWSNRAEDWISSRVDALTKHLRDCIHQPDDVRNRALEAHAASLSQRRERDRRRWAHQHATTVTPPAVNAHHDLDAELSTAVAGVEAIVLSPGVGTDIEPEHFLMPPVSASLTAINDPSAAPFSSHISPFGDYMAEDNIANVYEDYLGYPGPFERNTFPSAYTDPTLFPELPADLLSELDTLDDATLALIWEVLDYPVLGS